MTVGRNPYRKLYLVATALVCLGFAILAPAIEQDLGYHRFADQKGLWNVATNLPFVIAGIWALKKRASVLAAGVLLTGIGSAHYHWSPSDARLTWDRLPMTVVFMALLATITSEWAGWRLLWPMVAFGVASVVWWQQTGDLRWYAVVQFGPALVLVPAGVTDARLRQLWPAAVLYALAKLAESYDAAIFRAIGFGGHAIKHLLASAAAYWILRWSFTYCGTESPNSARHQDEIRTAR